MELPNTDTSSGHGTHVAGIVAGDGTSTAGYYKGVAPDAELVGLGAGDGLSILYALQGFDWLGQHGPAQGVKIVNNSWGTTGPFSPNDPINVATKKLHDELGMVIVFAAGNEGPEANTLNPYSVAPWVIGVAAGTKDGQLADFSSRGIPGDSLYRPTLTAPGVRIASTRASTGATINALTARDDLTGCVRTEDIARYTCASGTSMAAPHVSGVVALMLEAKPGLHPDIIKQVLIDTARSMVKPDGTPYAEHEVGAGYVDAYAAVKRAMRTALKKGMWKDPKTGKTYATYSVTDTWTGTVNPSVDPVVVSSEVHPVAIGPDAVRATVRISWPDPVQDIDLYVYAPDGSLIGKSAQGLTNTEETAFSGSPMLPAGTYRVVAQGWLNAVVPYEGTMTVEYVIR